MFPHLPVRKEALHRQVHSFTRFSKRFILGLNWQSNYKIGCNWNINGHHYITHNTYLCSSIPLTITKPIVQNAVPFYLQPRGILIITVQASIELKPHYIYKLTTSHDLPSELIPLAVYHKINHKYPNLLNIPILNMAHSKVYIPKLTIFWTLKPVKMTMWKFLNCLYSISTKQFELLLWRAGLTAQHTQGGPIFFIQLNYVHNNKEIRYCHLMLNSPATRWNWGFHFLLISEAMQGKHWEEDVGLLGLLSRAIVPTV